MSEVGQSGNSEFKKPEVSPSGRGRGGFPPRNSPGNNRDRFEQGNVHGMSDSNFPRNQGNNFHTTPPKNRKDQGNRPHSRERQERNSNGRGGSQERNRDRSNSRERRSNRQWDRSPQSNIGQGYNGGSCYNSPKSGYGTGYSQQSYFSNSPHGGYQEQQNWGSPNSHSSQQRGRGRHSYGSDGQTPERNRHRWDEDPDVFLSKTLSSILRHNAERFGFQLMKGGFLYVDEILRYVQKLHGYTVDDVKRVVDSNDKKRFALETEEGRLKIRANQGHSIQVEDLDLTPVLSAADVPVVIHGTYYTSWELIKKSGLRRMNRNHIHFAAGEPGENGVISGMRKTCEVMIYIDMEKALKAGLKFYRSANNVILCSGDENGVIYPCYFSGVLDRLRYHRLEFDHTISSSTVVEGKPSDSKKRKKKNKGKNKQEAVPESWEEQTEEPVTKEPEDGASTDDTSLPEAKKLHVSQPETPDTQTPDSSQTETVAMETNRNENSDVESDEEVNDEVKSKDWKEPHLIISVDESKDLVNRLCEDPPSHIAINCFGENLGHEDSRIRIIVITFHPDTYVYHLHDENHHLVKDGLLDQLLIDKRISKVFHDIGAVSTGLIREFDVLMDGAPIWDISILFDKVQLAQMDLEELECSKGMFTKWRKQNKGFGKRMSKAEDFDAEFVADLVERGKLVYDMYRLCSKKLNENLTKKLKKEIFDAAIPSNDSVDQVLAEKIKTLKLERKGKKPADKSEGASAQQQQQPQQQQQQQQQQKQKHQQQQKQQSRGKSGKGKRK